jgi:hypothetical protein
MSLVKEYKEKYLESNDRHALTLDTLLRFCIGKTDDINVPLCSHKAIINRELGEKFCRVCQKDLSKAGIGRYNDYLVLRHELCQQPICLDCAINNPDEFHKAFKLGLEEYKNIDKRLLL